jgi:hypothetical protein
LDTENGSISRTVLSSEGDTALRRCMRVAAELDRGQPRTLLPLIVRSPLAATVDCVSICENFVHGRVRSIIDRHVDGMNDIVLATMYKQAKSIDSSWTSVRDAAKNYLGFDLFSLEEYPPFAGLIEVRNAALHGGGALTAQQRKREDETVRKIKRAGFDLRGIEIDPPGGSALPVARMCGRMITAVDFKTWSPGGGLVSVVPVS